MVTAVHGDRGRVNTHTTIRNGSPQLAVDDVVAARFRFLTVPDGVVSAVSSL